MRYRDEYMPLVPSADAIYYYDPPADTVYYYDLRVAQHNNRNDWCPCFIF